MRNPRFKPLWLRAEGDEWQGLWEKGVFKKGIRSDLLPNDRVFTSRYVYKIKRSAKTEEAHRFKARMIVRACEMEKGEDYVDNFSPGLAVPLMMSLAIANDMELHKIDMEQAFLEADKLEEGVNGRYFINPTPGSPEAGNKNMVYEVFLSEMTFRGLGIWDLGIMTRVGVRKLGEIDGLGLEQSRMD